MLGVMHDNTCHYRMILYPQVLTAPSHFACHEQHDNLQVVEVQTSALFCGHDRCLSASKSILPATLGQSFAAPVTAFIQFGFTELAFDNGNCYLVSVSCSLGTDKNCRCQHMRDHPHHQQAPPHSLLLQATPAMTSPQMNMTVRNKRNGGSAAKAGSPSLDPTCLMAIVQRLVDGVDTTCWFLILG